MTSLEDDQGPGIHLNGRRDRGQKRNGPSDATNEEGSHRHQSWESEDDGEFLAHDEPWGRKKWRSSRGVEHTGRSQSSCTGDAGGTGRKRWSRKAGKGVGVQGTTWPNSGKSRPAKGRGLKGVATPCIWRGGKGSRYIAASDTSDPRANYGRTPSSSSSSLVSSYKGPFQPAQCTENRGSLCEGTVGSRAVEVGGCYGVMPGLSALCAETSSTYTLS